MRVGYLWTLCLLILAWSASAEELSVRRGDYEARLGVSGLEVRYRSVPVVVGSSFSLFKPRYEGAHFATTDIRSFAPRREGDRLTTAGRIPPDGAEFSHQVLVTEDGVQVWFSLRLPPQEQPLPLELALLMFPPEEFAGGRYALHTPFGQGRAQLLPLQKPATSAPGTLQIAGGVREMTLTGRRVQLSLRVLSDTPAVFYDMRSRDFPEPQRVYWLLFSRPLQEGEWRCGVQLQAKLLETQAPFGKGAGRLTLREGGRQVQVSRIFVQSGAHPVEKAAARELQQTLLQMTGQEVPLAEGNGDDLPAQGVLYVGRSEQAKARGLYAESEFDPLGTDGLLIRLRGGNLLVAGGGYRGTVYAVYRLLERLGCRYYSTELEVLPRRATLEIRAPLEVVDKPAFEWRAMWGRVLPMTAGLSPGEWEAKVGEVDLPKMMAIPPRGFWHHTMGFLLPAQNVPKEYLAEIGGERRITEPHLQQYCLSHPDLQRAMTDAVLKWIESDPDPIYYPVHYGDTGQFCQCQRCKAWYEEHGSLTDAVIWFNNQIAQEVARRFPGKFVTTLAYWATRKPPVRERPLPNHLIIFCAIVECQARPWSHPVNMRFNVIPDLERWIALHPLGAQGIITFEYPTTYHFVGYPYPALYAFAENLKYYKRLGIRGVYICGLSDGHLIHLYSYVMPRLMWNPDANLQQLIEEFCQAWYGKAWQPMRDYVRLLHESAFASRSEGVMDCHAGPGQQFFRELFTREWLDRKVYPLFRRAEQRAENDLIRRRVWREKWGVLFTDLFLHMQQGRDLVPDSSERGYTRQMPSLDSYVRLAELLRLTRQLERSWVVEPQQWRRFTLSDLIGFEPTRQPWWECPRVGQLMEDPQSLYEQEQRAFSEEEVARYLVRLESPHLMVDLVPNLGGRIWRLYSRAHRKDILWRNRLEWRLLRSGHRGDQYLNYGGYEEYVGERFGSPGWSERYEYALSPDRRSATLTTTLRNGLRVTRVVTLSDAEPSLTIETRVENRSNQPIPDVVLRTHPQFQVEREGLTLLVRNAQEEWQERAVTGETFLSGVEMPAGAWGLRDRSGVLLLNEFDPSQVRQCYLYTSPYFSNLELFSQPKTLAPGESLVLRHRYVLRLP
ncbi:MAG: DUF4838 domain-containing protein [Armatimonadetes bacterium]|nr:DUF4838 domain-containing protein [Armatimonadota bacterium]